MFKDFSIVDGICSLDLSSWDDFYKLYYKNMTIFKGYIWRGQKDANWKLESTIDRLLKDRGLDVKDEIDKHFNNFIFAARGRRNKNAVKLNNEDEWWALGQHNGLSTPLLDWTTSPFVAAFFAFNKGSEDDTLKRGVFALHQESIIEKSNSLEEEGIKFIKPFSDENARLVNQSGLFTRTPVGIDIESWVKKNYKGVSDQIVLLKITLPNNQRETCLKILNSMNINYLTLFPDLYGASRYCNMIVKIRNYCN
ncbi:FRG domain-containing protein [Natranaerovirga pectinivora]|uniref:FRG domain-containing protein n=1 Tax=Natranaerovirga pectinivora TaxID=682400 RepID=A0A4R3MKX1_9FIRM|nr:FRG domain-containing protein [Natranaerovirga pectinivora]TCT14363.1 FRG domain-containing protein [Natranaerovirga pectinivora]